MRGRLAGHSGPGRQPDPGAYRERPGKSRHVVPPLAGQADSGATSTGQVRPWLTEQPLPERASRESRHDATAANTPSWLHPPGDRCSEATPMRPTAVPAATPVAAAPRVRFRTRAGGDGTRCPPTTPAPDVSSGLTADPASRSFIAQGHWRRTGQFV